MTESTTAGPTRLESFKAEDAASANVAHLIALLDLQARIETFHVLKQWALDSLAPQAGESALDIGSGTGEDVQALAAAVGPTGRAVGIELNEGLRAEAARRATAAGSTAEYVDGDALSLPFDDASFDVVRSERVFQHLSDPYAAAAEIARVLRPGGRVVIVDTDWRTAVLNPIPPDVEEALSTMMLSQWANARSGSRLREYLAQAGLVPGATTAQTWIQEQFMARTPPASLIGAQAVERGVLTPEQAERLTAGFATAADEGWFHMSLTMFAALAVKPSTSTL